MSPHPAHDRKRDPNADQDVADAEDIGQGQPGRECEDVGQGPKRGIVRLEAVGVAIERRQAGRGGCLRRRGHVAAIGEDRRQVAERPEGDGPEAGQGQVPDDEDEDGQRRGDVDRRSGAIDHRGHRTREEYELHDEAHERERHPAEGQRR
ncbi:MAG TPA: hypothetical protein VGQ47_03450 [Candidatus Limnocylindrales bacterium]|nr:hypothetical protein [Candidatus Limnocylindrales bacterium]